MTLDEFLVGLSKTPRKWKIVGQSIRMLDADGHRTSCPITSLRGEYIWQWKQAADELGLEPALAQQIANAADCRIRAFEPTRKLLLEACGLTENKELN